MAGMVYCNRKMADAGKACETSSDCEGKCIKPTNSETKGCQAHELEYGCFTTYEPDKEPATLCID